MSVIQILTLLSFHIHKVMRGPYEDGQRGVMALKCPSIIMNGLHYHFSPTYRHNLLFKLGTEPYDEERL